MSDCYIFRNTQTTLKNKNHVSSVASTTGHLTLQMSMAQGCVQAVLEYLQSS